MAQVISNHNLLFFSAKKNN